LAWVARGLTGYVAQFILLLVGLLLAIGLVFVGQMAAEKVPGGVVRAGFGVVIALVFLAGLSGVVGACLCLRAPVARRTRIFLGLALAFGVAALGLGALGLWPQAVPLRLPLGTVPPQWAWPALGALCAMASGAWLLLAVRQVAESLDRPDLVRRTRRQLASWVFWPVLLGAAYALTLVEPMTLYGVVVVVLFVWSGQRLPEQRAMILIPLVVLGAVGVVFWGALSHEEGMQVFRWLAYVALALWLLFYLQVITDLVTLLRLVRGAIREKVSGKRKG
jgi:hypothetical protein